ncbi:ribosome assembly cofactor RimP [Flavicella sp.]|uniref:ribosome assembly cofactor RimP n=1 Tax=Flavicella sp. TaxID=2957742 RepID=UPI00301B4C51
MNKELVEQLITDALGENSPLFLISLEFLVDNKISIIIDGDEGVPLNECIRLSRAVESELDREEEDFSLEVSSPDVTKPLIVFRQFKKNIGRTLSVKTAEEKIEGKLVEVIGDDIILNWSAREPKPIGKGKVTVQKSATIPYNSIIEAKVKLIF